MINVKIESLLDNIVIFENELYFKLNNRKYTQKPYNKYYFNSDSYDTVQVFLYHPDYLGFYSTYNINNFKNYCLNKLAEDIIIFKYKGLSIILEEIEDKDINLKEMI